MHMTECIYGFWLPLWYLQTLLKDMLDCAQKYLPYLGFIGFYWRFHMIFCGIVSKQFKKYLTLHVDKVSKKTWWTFDFPVWERVKHIVPVYNALVVLGRYCACEILIANPIDWLYAACLEFIFFLIDSSEARK
jgi:hypothetical protein